MATEQSWDLAKVLDSVNHRPRDYYAGTLVTIGDLRDIEALLRAQTAQIARLREAITEALTMGEMLREIDTTPAIAFSILFGLRKTLEG